MVSVPVRSMSGSHQGHTRALKLKYLSGMKTWSTLLVTPANFPPWDVKMSPSWLVRLPFNCHFTFSYIPWSKISVESAVRGKQTWIYLFHLPAVNPSRTLTRRRRRHTGVTNNINAVSALFRCVNTATWAQLKCINATQTLLMSSVTLVFDESKCLLRGSWNDFEFA